MVNELKVATIRSIQSLLRMGWSYRRIARELGIHRDTVARQAQAFASESSKPAISTPGFDLNVGPKPAISTAGVSGRRSDCTGYESCIRDQLALGLSATRIHQDLVQEHGFTGSYQSVKRFAHRLQQRIPLPFRRMECAPGEEAQVDFGRGAPTKRPGKRPSRPHLLRLVLSCSRKGCSEVVWHQTTEDFLRCLENAFHELGGVPRWVILDNLKAGVLQADWYDPEINPKFADFAEHYGFVVMPTKSYTPRHKGKIEAGVKYVQENAVKGRLFESLEDQNRFLKDWEARVADVRIHGTTRKQVRALFEEVERSALLPLPSERFPFFHENRCKVHRDGHVQVAKSYYSVPPHFLGQELWVRWDSRIVRIFNDQFQQVALHLKVEPGTFSTQSAHIAPEKINAIEKGTEYLLERAQRIGPKSQEWALALIQARGIAGIRTLQGFLSIAKKHSGVHVERACELALSFHAYRLKAIRALLKHEAPKKQLEFLESHPVIRDMAVYGEVVRSALQSSTSLVPPVLSSKGTGS